MELTVRQFKKKRNFCTTESIGKLSTIWYFLSFQISFFWKTEKKFVLLVLFLIPIFLISNKLKKKDEYKLKVHFKQVCIFLFFFSLCV
jgi:hypothetical protein